MSSDNIFVWLLDENNLGFGVKRVGTSLHTTTRLQTDAEGTEIDIQNPLPTDGDSVYAKDIWVGESTATNWLDESAVASEDNVLIPFTGLHSIITNSTSDNPKLLRVHLNRTVFSHQVGLGAFGGGNFSNVKITLIGSGDVPRTIIDNSADDTKYTSRNISFEPQGFNAVDIEFYTTDTITLSNIIILKAPNVSAQIYGLRADGEIGVVNVTNGNNLKVSLEELENQVSVNSNSQLKVTLFNSAGSEIATDSVDTDLVTISHEHHEIHEGKHFFIGNYTTLDATETIDLIITTPDTATRVHFLAIASSSGEMVASIYEGVTETGDGTVVPIFNSDRNSATASTLVIKTDPTTVSDTGTLLRAHSGGSSGPFAVGTTARGTSENILKQNTKYMVRLLSNAASNIIDWEFIWYEV